MPNSVPPRRPSDPVATILERRRHSEEERLKAVVPDFSAINEALAKRGLAREAELKREFEAKRLAKAAKVALPLAMRLKLPMPPSNLRRVTTHDVHDAYQLDVTAPFTEPAIDWREDVLSGYAETRGQALTPGMSPAHRPSRRAYFDLTPGQRTPNARGDYFAPMHEADARPDLDAPERLTMQDRMALCSMGVGILALAMPVALIVGRAVKVGVEAILDRLGLK